MKKKLKQALGNWVEGERFWDREKDVELFIERIEQGAHLLLVAQRRMGKTSLMREVARQLKDRYLCVFVDLQKALNASDAIAELSIRLKPHKSLWQKTKEVFKNAFDRAEKIEIKDVAVTLRSGLDAGNWAVKGDRLFQILAASEKPVLLLFDEVPIMVNRLLKGDDFRITPKRRLAADEFMSWLRKNSIEHQGNIRIVLSGSIGFEPILRQARLSETINNFSSFELKPWDQKTAVACLNALSNEYGVQFQQDAAARMVRLLGSCIPHHVQMFFTYVREKCKRRRRMKFFPDEVDEVYQTEMLSTRGHVDLMHYEERLKLVLGPEVLPLALEMLTETAVMGSLSREALEAFQKAYTFKEQSAAEAQQEILRVLEHDGYLELRVKDYVFGSRLIRDWWRKRYGSFHIPILERGV